MTDIEDAETLEKAQAIYSRERGGSIPAMAALAELLRAKAAREADPLAERCAVVEKINAQLVDDLKASEAWREDLATELQRYKDVIDEYQAVLELVTKTRNQIESDLARERSTWCDKPEDRLYHAEDGTWWRRDEHGACKRADPPAELTEAVRVRKIAESEADQDEEAVVAMRKELERARELLERTVRVMVESDLDGLPLAADIRVYLAERDRSAP
jgi:DNA-binding ferritin-like protein